ADADNVAEADASQAAHDVTDHELAAFSAQFDERNGYSVADDSTDAGLQQAIVEADALSLFDAGETADDALVVDELTGSDDLSDYFNAA
ncbi:hypothetical protein, partial [Stenotrophomonas sp. SrG]|uniref:hypothetical protein n=1 Tax=Stenotrophomonas sp. SrG TaxID=3414430 RepID=UPI003CEC4D29